MKNYIQYLQPGNSIIPLQQDNTSVSIKTPIEPIEVTKGTYQVLPYETPNNLSNIANEELQNKLNKDLLGKSKDEIKEIQKKIADAGYYDQFLRKMSKDEIINLQKRMLFRGLYSGKIDGIIGNKTINGYRQYNIDGILGNRTREGYKNLLAPQINYSYGATCTPDKGCAEFVTHSYNKSTDQADQNGVVGNAWTMPMNVVKYGGTELFNIYSDPRFKKRRGDVNAIRNLHRELLATNKIDLTTLKPGDIVGMYNPGSPYQELANREGTTFNSHVGIVAGIDSDGMPIIEHNMHGSVRRERADRLGKRSISVAVRPKTTDKLPTINWDLQKSDFNVSENIDNDNLKVYRDSMAGFAPTISKIFPNIPVNKMQELALGILGRETDFMNDLESNRTGIAGLKRDAESWVRTNIFRESPISKSSDLTKTKFTSFTPEERQFLGITSPEDLNDPKKAGAAVLYLLSKNYNYMSNYSNTYPELGLTDDDKINATILSYNLGMGKNSPARSWGFDSNTGVADPYELEILREHSDINKKVDSYPATKYAKVDKLIGKVLPIKPGKFLYNLMGNPNDREGYAATTLKNISKYINSRKLGGKLNYLNYINNVGRTI